MEKFWYRRINLKDGVSLIYCDVWRSRNEFEDWLQVSNRDYAHIYEWTEVPYTCAVNIFGPMNVPMEVGAYKKVVRR